MPKSFFLSQEDINYQYEDSMSGEATNGAKISRDLWSAYLDAHPLRGTEEITTIRQAQTEDPEAINNLIGSYFGTIIKLAHKYWRPRLDINDLIQDGIEGLMQSLPHFDFRKDNTPLTFFYWRIRGNIVDQLPKGAIYEEPTDEILFRDSEMAVPHPSETLTDAAYRADLESLIDKLRAKFKGTEQEERWKRYLKIFEDYMAGGKTMEDIALEESADRSWISRIIQQVRSELETIYNHELGGISVERTNEPNPTAHAKAKNLKRHRTMNGKVFHTNQTLSKEAFFVLVESFETILSSMTFQWDWRESLLIFKLYHGLIPSEEKPYTQDELGAKFGLNRKTIGKIILEMDRLLALKDDPGRLKEALKKKRFFGRKSKRRQTTAAA